MQTPGGAFDCANDAKANFDSIYNQPDPRQYYRTLGALDYSIPTGARDIFVKVMKAMNRDHLSVIDVGCSYGVNAAMIRYDLDFSDLVARYDKEAMRDKSVAEVIVSDAGYYAEAQLAVDADFTGVDVAGEAAGYAKAVGLLEEIVVENLEASPPSTDALAAFANADLIITTGAVGYVTARTFSRLIDAANGPPPWVAAFTLRQFPFEAIAEELESFDLVTEKLEGRQFAQRRFRDTEEQAGAIEAVRALGLDPAGLESQGGYFAEFYLSRPAGSVEIATLDL